MIDKLESFIALAKERHFGRAAVELGVTQPTLSAAMRQLSFPVVQRICLFDTWRCMVKAFGSCRHCLVEIGGREGTPAALTPAMKMDARHTPFCPVTGMAQRESLP